MYLKLMAEQRCSIEGSEIDDEVLLFLKVETSVSRSSLSSFDVLHDGLTTGLIIIMILCTMKNVLIDVDLPSISYRESFAIN